MGRQLCGTAVDSLGRHALSCRRSKGRHQWHAALNDTIKRGLSAAHVPSKLEPVGLLRSDGKRPDSVTLAPWKTGSLMIWDATCPDTFAPSAHATQEPGKVAEAAEDRKCEKYMGLPPGHFFSPVAIETFAGPTASEQRQVSRSAESIYSNGSLWQFSGGTRCWRAH